MRCVNVGHIQNQKIIREQEMLEKSAQPKPVLATDVRNATNSHNVGEKSPRATPIRRVRFEEIGPHADHTGTHHVLGVLVGAGIQQQPRAVRVTILSGPHQRRPSVLRRRRHHQSRLRVARTHHRDTYTHTHANPLTTLHHMTTVTNATKLRY